MAFREVSVVEIREVLRLWLRGTALRRVTGLTGVDRKTVRRYVQAAVAGGLLHDGGEEQLTDELIGHVCERVRPARPYGHGAAWSLIAAEHGLIKGWLDDDGLTVVKVHVLLSRRGIEVPYRTLHRYAVSELGFGKRQPTLRVADGEPGQELQVDFGRMGLLRDGERRRVCHALIFTAAYSRHCFAWLTFRQTTEAVIAGFEAAWQFFGGVFAVVVPDNMGTIVAAADSVAPRLSDAFREYAQARGFVVDPARVAHPKDKPRVERTVPYLRKSFFAGETFRDLAEAQERVVCWCLNDAGRRVHGTTQLRPLEVFTLEEAPRLLPPPLTPYQLPLYATAKVHRDHHIEVDRALYSIPGDRIGCEVQVRADAVLVKVYHRGQLIKVHPRQAPGGRSTDPDDLPSERTAYALRDVDYLRRRAAEHGDWVGRYAVALLDTPLPWTRMRQVYRLLGLAQRYGADAVDAACERALEAEAVNVGLIGRILERAAEHGAQPPPRGRVLSARFARDHSEFAVGASTR
jgi:transposase